MKRIILVASSLVLLSGCKSAPQETAAPAVPVSVYVIRPETISSFVKLTGGIEAEEDAIVYSKISERLELIRVKEGDMVRAGQVLAEQYNRSLRESVNQASAALRTAQSQHDMAKNDFDRMQRLAEDKAISPQQMEQATAQFEAARSGLDQAKAGLKMAQELYENSLIKAPFQGHVAILYYDRGQMVPAGQPVVKIVNARNVKAKLAVPEVDMSRVAQGQRVLATFPGFADTQFTGSVYRVDKAINPATRTMDIEIRMDNQTGLLKSGQFGQFLIETACHEQSVVVPDVAVMTQTNVDVSDRGEQREVKKYYAFAVKDGKARQRFVQPGIYSQGRVEVTEGMSIGDSLIVMGQNIVKDGSPVRVVTRQETHP